MTQKAHWYWFFGGLLAVAVLVYRTVFCMNDGRLVDRIGNHLSRSYIHDSIAASNGNYGQLDNSPFLIRISDEDNLIYWNDDFSLDNPNSNGKLFFSAFGSKGLNIEFSLPYDNEYGYRSRFLPEIENLAYFRQDDDGEYVLNIGNLDLQISLTTVPRSSILSLIFLAIWFLALSLLCGFLFKMYKRKSNEFQYFLSLLVFWLAISYVVHPFFFRYNIFQSIQYQYVFGSKSVLGLLFDLLILIFLFLGIGNGKVKKNLYRIRTDVRLLIGAFLVSGMFYWKVSQIENFIFSNDELKINVNNILELNSPKFVFLLCLIGYSFLSFYISTLFFKKENDKTGIARRTIFVELGLIFSTMIYVFIGYQTPAFPILLFLMIFFLCIDLYSDLLDRNISFILWWILLYSGFLAINIYYTSLKKDFSERKENLEQTFAPLSDDERRMVKNFSRDFKASELLNNISGLQFGAHLDYNDILTLVTNEFDRSELSSTFDIEDIDCFTGYSNSLFSNKKADLLRSRQSRQFGLQLNENLYYLPFSPQVNLVYPIENEFQFGGPINFEIRLKHRANANSKPINSYLIFKDSKLIEARGIADLENNEVLIRRFQRDTIIGNISFLYHKVDSEYEVVAFSKVAGFIKPITLFSFIFSVFGLLLVLLTIANSRFGFLPEDLELRFHNQSSLRSRIQIAIITLVIFSFLFIGVITAFYFNNLSNTINRSNFEQEVAVISKDIQKVLQDVYDNDAAQNILLQLSGDLNSTYEGRIRYYDHNGHIITLGSNQSSGIELLPYAELKNVERANSGATNIGVSSIFLNEDMVLLPIYKDDNIPIGYFTVDGRTNQQDEYNVFEYLSTLLNVYIFLFLLAGAIAIFIANSITRPLIKLKESLQKFKLGKQNKTLDWVSNDEIGDLIKDYNKMTEELSKSASIIAKTERDMAWREMAKQVAHEIKNPLTPMKLNIQYLERAVNADPIKAQEMIGKISKTLVEQINNLSQIAGEFSNFAALPKSSNEKIILNEVVEHIHDLFRKRDDMDIELIEPMNDIYVFADRNQLVRILNNIVKNAIQSIPPEKRGHIEMELRQNDENAIIRVSDNGVGIPEEMKSKVFTPNFTTKSSGTGLGLAIASNMLESMNGRLYFETEFGVGSDFFIELPSIRPVTAKENEVLLDEGESGTVDLD